jgi:putative ABC transport system permease protein
MMTLLRRLRYLFRQRQIEAEIAEEIEAHRLMAEGRERSRGTARGEADAASRRAMGNITLAREEARAAWISPWLESAYQDVAYALRMFRRAPAFTATLVLVLGLGIGATTAVFTLVDGLILRDLPVRSPDRLVYFSSPSFSYPIFAEVRSRSADVIESVAAWSVEDFHVAWGQELEPAGVLTASGGFYATLGVTAAAGRTFSEEDDQIGGGPHGRVAVISDAAWRRRFGGDPGVIGRTVRVGRDTYTIVGVTPRGYSGITPGIAPEITIPLTSNARPGQLKSPTSSWVHLIARLRGGVTLRQANASLAQFWPAVLDATVPTSMDAERRAHLLGRKTSLESASAGFSRVRNRFAEPLWFLFALVGVLLLVGCASAANLLLARGAGRRREIAVRLAIGAGRTRLVRQMLTESLVWTLLASIAGLLIASWGASSLVALMSTREQKIDLDAGVSFRVMLFALAVAAVTSAVCSVLPAVGATRIDPAAGLKTAPESNRTMPSRWASGQWIVSAQVALSVLLLGSAALFGRSLYSVLSQSAGVDRQNVLVLATDVDATGYDEERAARFYQELLERVRRVPGVAAASLSMYPPISGGDGAWTENVGIDGAPPRPGSATVYFNTVSSNYFGTTGMTLLRGRDIGDGDHESSLPVAVVNETLARHFFQGQDPLGRQITIGRDKSRKDLQIIGLVSDAKYQRLQETPRAVAYLPWQQQRGDNMFIEMRVTPRTSVADLVRREVRALDAVVPIHMQTVADRIRESIVTERVLASLAGLLAAVAAVLVCAGLYGLLAYNVSRKTREIGVRLALGAERRAVVLRVLSESVVLALTGIAAGVAATVALGRFARGLLFQVTPADPVSLAIAAALMLVVACLAGFGPAWRASRVDPVIALKAE